MTPIFYMRFRMDTGRHIYLVGTSTEKMRLDAPRIAPLAEGAQDGEIVDSEIVVAEAERVGKNASGRTGMDMLKAGVAAARNGDESYYLFG